MKIKCYDVFNIIILTTPIKMAGIYDEKLFTIITQKWVVDTHHYLIYNGIQIGRCVVTVTHDKELYIKYITIYKAYRGYSVGKIFYKLLEDKIFIKDKIKIVTLMAEELANKHNKLENLYKSWGFHKTSERYTYNYDTPVRHIYMTKILATQSKL